MLRHTGLIYDAFRYVFLTEGLWGWGLSDSYLRIFHLSVNSHWNTAATLLQTQQHV